MQEKIYIYNLLSSSQEPLQVRVPETLLNGYGFQRPTLITYNTYLNFNLVPDSEVFLTLSYLMKSHTVLCRTSNFSSIITEMPSSIEETFFFQEFIEGEHLTIKWNCKEGYINTKNPIQVRLQCECVKHAINKFLIASNQSRLTHLELQFVQSNNLNFYFIAVSFYKFSSLKSLTRVHSLDNRLVPTEKKQKSLKKNATHENLPKIKEKKNEIGDIFSDLMKNCEAVKYMRWNQWKKIEENSPKLLSNEMLYSKKIQGISTRILVKSTKHVKDIRKMAALMKHILNENEIINNIEEINKIKKVARKSNFKASLRPSVLQINKEPASKGPSIFDKILNEASEKLDHLQSKKNLLNKS